MRAQIEKMCDLGKYVRDSGRAMHPIAHNRGKGPIIPYDVDTPVDDKLSSSSSLSMSLSPAKNARESIKAKNSQALGNASVFLAGKMPPKSLVHLAFGTWPTLYMPPTAFIRRPDDTFSSPLGQHILTMRHLASL